MAFQVLKGGLSIPTQPTGMSSAPSLSSTALLTDANDEAAALICRAPKTGNIANVGWGLRTVTTGATVDVRLETVDLTTGNPSGTLLATNTNASVVVDAADDNTFKLTTLTAAAAVTKGQLFAVVIKQPAASAGSMQIAGFQDELWREPFGLLYTTSWAKVILAVPNMAFEYDDGSYEYVMGVLPIKSAITSTSFGDFSNPNVRGLRFQFPFPVRVTGCWVWFSPDGNFDVKLVTTAYHKANATGILASLSVDKDVRVASSAGVGIFQFPETPELSANTNYRLVVIPTTTDVVGIYDYDVHSQAMMDATMGGRLFHYTTAQAPTGDGDWTNYNSGTFRIPFMGLILDAFSDGVGGGGGGASQLVNAGALVG